MRLGFASDTIIAYRQGLLLLNPTYGLQFNEKGQLLSNNLANYKIPDIYFMPDLIDIKFLENDGNSPAPYGSKAVGEPPFMYGIGVFFAIHQAMKAFKPKMEFAFTSPLTPERVLCELQVEELKEMAESNDTLLH